MLTHEDDILLLYSVCKTQQKKKIIWTFTTISLYKIIPTYEIDT